MGNSVHRLLPNTDYLDLYLPSGRHAGIRLDLRRGLLELQTRGTRYYFDLAELVARHEQACYTDGERNAV